MIQPIIDKQEFIAAEKNNILCKRCHRKLKNDESIKLGFGKTCYKKQRNKSKIYLFDIKENDI